MVIAREHYMACFRGEGRIRNLPDDAVAVAEVPQAKGFAFRVHSERFDIAPAGEPLPVVQAVLERKSADENAEAA